MFIVVESRTAYPMPSALLSAIFSVPLASFASTGNPGGAEGEFVFYFTHGGPGTSQGESLMRDFGGRTVGNSQNWVYPEYVLADRYRRN